MNINVSTRTLRSVARTSSTGSIFRIAARERGASRLDNSIHLGAFRFRLALRESEPLLDHIKWTPLDLGVNTSKIFAQDAQRNELHAAHEKHGDKERRPSAREVFVHHAIDDCDDDSRHGDPDCEKTRPDREF